MDTYGKSPIMKALSKVTSISKVASMSYTDPYIYNDIKKMRKSLKRKASDIDSLRKTWAFPNHKAKIKFINVELSLVDIDFMQYMEQTNADIYNALGIPKEYQK